MTIPQRERDLIRHRFLGESIACVKIVPGTTLGRDLTLANGSNGIDFARVTGMDCMGQALKIALTTLLGSDVFNTQFGFDGLKAMVEERDAVMIRERIRVAVIMVLRRDPRVRRIVDVKLDDGRLELPPPGSRTLDVRVAFETVTGDQTTIDLGSIPANV